MMVMVVVVVVNRERSGNLLAKHADESRIGRDLFGMTRTADMSVQAQHLIRRGHDQMEVV